MMPTTHSAENIAKIQGKLRDIAYEIGQLSLEDQAQITNHWNSLDNFLTTRTDGKNRERINPQGKELRQSGIEVIGAVPWGTHFCQFYATSQDLVETLVPYFRAGLTANEFCMWVTSAPLQVDQAQAALRSAMPDLDDYLAKGQIEILDYRQWYTSSGAFDSDAVLSGWMDKLSSARQRSFCGLRLSGNTFWLEQSTWEDFFHYEEKVNEVIGEQRMIALCTYSLEKCGVREILDVLANHQFALIKTEGHWEIIESTKHKEMEQALRESEARYHSMFEGMTEGFALHEIICSEAGEPVDYRFLDINPSFERLTGLKRADVVGKLHNTLLPNDDPQWVKTFGRVALTGDSVHFEDYSSALKMHYDVYAYRPAPGQFAVIFLNITERKRLEADMQKLSQAIEQSPASIVITDTHGTIEYVNPQFCELTGYSAEEARGQNPNILKSGLNPAAQYKDLWKTISSGKIWRGEFCNKKKNGEFYWESAQISPVIDKLGQIINYIAIKEDITLRKQVESALHESEERARQLAEDARINLEKLESVIDSMNELVMLFDPRGNLVRINPAGMSLFGFSTKGETRISDLIRDTLDIVNPNGQLVQLQEEDLLQTLRGGQVVNVERVVRRKDTGKQWTGLFSTRPILDSRGELMILLVTAVDISNLRQTQREFMAAQAWMDVQHRLIGQRELERLQIARDLHDGPVQELTGATFTLRGILMEGCSPELAEQLEALQQTLQDQISELRAYAGELRPPTLTKFGLVKAIQSHMEIFQEKHHELLLRFKEAWVGEKLPEEKGIAIFRVYQETLTNIVKHAHATEVAVELFDKDHKGFLTIQDDGNGFELPQDWLTLARNGHLGLVGMRERIEAIGGRLEIDSQPGKGTVIRVEVPTTEPDEDVETARIKGI